jgi:nicotinate-nucleotide adenylyltransferase
MSTAESDPNPAPRGGPGASQAPGPRRLGLFGGSFDPVHLGHLHAARAAQEAFGLDRVVFVPAARPPHKPGRVLASGEDRMAMLERALAGQASWSVSDLELRRSGPSYTLDTVRDLARAVGEPEEASLFMILGSDNLPGLPEWSRVEELLARVQPIVIFRTGVEVSQLTELESRLSAAALERLRAGFLELPPLDASSTEIRENVRSGLEPGVQLSPEVREYIREKGLYTPHG